MLPDSFEIERIAAPAPRFTLMDDMVVEVGTIADWNLLHDLHYKAENLASGSRFWRLRLGKETIGVLVMANPKPMLKERHLAFPQIKPGGRETTMTNTWRYNWVNQNVRVISRFVLDIPYRGVGIGYRFMNLASRMENFRKIEIQSSMSKYNLFGPRAGFSFVPPMNSLKFEVGVKFFKGHFAANPSDFEAMLNELDAMPGRLREKTIAACRAFYLRNSALENTGGGRLKGPTRVAEMDPRTLIKSMQQMILASPLYGTWENPDYRGRSFELPVTLPLSEFALQGPCQPLARGVG